MVCRIQKLIAGCVLSGCASAALGQTATLSPTISIIPGGAAGPAPNIRSASSSGKTGPMPGNVGVRTTGSLPKPTSFHNFPDPRGASIDPALLPKPKVI